MPPPVPVSVGGRHAEDRAAFDRQEPDRAIRSLADVADAAGRAVAQDFLGPAGRVGIKPHDAVELEAADEVVARAVGLRLLSILAWPSR